MKKRVAQFLVGVMSFSTVAANVTAEKVDLSPLPQVSNVQPAQSSQESLTHHSENNVGDSSINHSENNSTNSSANSSVSPEQTLATDIAQPTSLLEALYSSTTKTTTNITVFESVKPESIKGATYSVVKDGDLRYLSMTNSSKMPLSALLLLKQGKVTQGWQSLDDLMSSAANLMQAQAEALKGTVIEKLVNYTQEHSNELIGKYVGIEDLETANQLHDTTEHWNQYFQVVLRDWLAQNIAPTKQENQQLRFELTDDMAVKFTEVMRKHEAEFPALKADFARFKTQYDGTIVLDFAQNQVAIGLIEGDVAIEYYLRAKDVPLTEPEADKVVTREQLAAQLGFDWFKGMQEVEAQLQ